MKNYKAPEFIFDEGNFAFIPKSPEFFQLPTPTVHLFFRLQSFIEKSSFTGEFTLRQIADLDKVLPKTTKRHLDNLVDAGFLTLIPVDGNYFKFRLREKPSNVETEVEEAEVTVDAN